MAYGILVPRPGMEPASPTLGSRFLATGLAGKSRLFCLDTHEEIGANSDQRSNAPGEL